MFFWNKFCGLIIFFLFSTAFSYAQYTTAAFKAPQKIWLKNNFVSLGADIFRDSKKSFLTFYQPRSANVLYQNTAVQPNENFYATFSSTIPGNLATCDYGFFCRQELKIEKTTNIPIRFRLGSLDQCNYYEGKH